MEGWQLISRVRDLSTQGSRGGGRPREGACLLPRTPESTAELRLEAAGLKPQGLVEVRVEGKWVLSSPSPPCAAEYPHFSASARGAVSPLHPTVAFAVALGLRPAAPRAGDTSPSFSGLGVDSVSTGSESFQLLHP